VCRLGGMANTMLEAVAAQLGGEEFQMNFGNKLKDVNDHCIMCIDFGNNKSFLCRYT